MGVIFLFVIIGLIATYLCFDGYIPCLPCCFLSKQTNRYAPSAPQPTQPTQPPNIHSANNDNNNNNNNINSNANTEIPMAKTISYKYISKSELQKHQPPPTAQIGSYNMDVIDKNQND